MLLFLYCTSLSLLHPDELAQSLVPALVIDSSSFTRVLNTEKVSDARSSTPWGTSSSSAAVPWEFTSSYRARSCFVPAITALPSFKAVHAINSFRRRVFKQQQHASLGATTTAFLRIAMTKINAAMLTATAHNAATQAAQAAIQTTNANAYTFVPLAWPTYVLGAKPLANAVEAVLYASLIAMNARSLRNPTQGKLTMLAVATGVVVAVGCTVRFTFVAFAAPLVAHGAWMAACSHQRKGGSITDAGVRAVTHAIVVATVVAVGLLGTARLDAACYERHGATFDALSGAKSRLGEVPRFLFTWLNNLRYNADGERVAREHGRHHRLTHVLVSMPWLCGPAYVFFMWKGALAFARTMRAPRDAVRVAYRNPAVALRAALFASVILPLALLSISPHQEPRFLLPVAWTVQWSASIDGFGNLGAFWRTAHATHQLIMPLVYAAAHQGGVVRSQLAVLGVAPLTCLRMNATEVPCSLEVAYAQTYPPSAALFDTTISDGVRIHVTDCMEDAACMARSLQMAHVVVAPPRAMRKMTTWRVERILFPHFSGETTPDEMSKALFDDLLHRGDTRSAWRRAYESLCLNVYTRI